MLLTTLLFSIPLAFTTPFQEGDAAVDYLNYQFETNYAPKTLKEREIGWDLTYEIELLRGSLSKGSTQIWRRSLKDFFDGMQDGHVNVRFQSTAHSILPFEIREADGRYFVVYVDLDRDPCCKLKVGDEIVTWNGELMQIVVQRFFEQEFTRCRRDRTWFDIALLYFTQREGELGFNQEEGEVVLQVSNESQLSEHVVSWMTFPELFPSNFFPLCSTRGGNPEIPRQSEESAVEQLAKTSAIVPFADTNLEKKSKKKNPFRLGTKQSFLPPLGNIIWQAWDRDPYKAYLFETPKGEKVGYLRIPHFNFDKETDFFSLGRTVRKLKEGGASLLIVDLFHNPGGLLLNMYAVISLLIEEPVEALGQYRVISSDQIDLALSVKSEIEKQKGKEGESWIQKSYYGYPGDDRFKEGLISYADFVLDEASRGVKISDVFPILGIDKILPNPKIRFGGPLLILIDSLDFSCGDCFPAILQDAERATLFGVRTGGAGGVVSPPISFSNRLGIGQFRLTTSIITRPSGKLIEGTGVEPDDLYSLKPEDFLQNFEPMREKILQKIDEILEAEAKRTCENLS